MRTSLEWTSVPCRADRYKAAPPVACVWRISWNKRGKCKVDEELVRKKQDRESNEGAELSRY